jgi:thymidylate synthase (FAD)
MAHNPELVPKHHAFRVLFGQKPLTRFKDYRNTIDVELIKHDDYDQMMKGTFDFVKATWSEDGREASRATEAEMKDALDAMLSGKALGLGLETVNFMFRIGGITRIDTHQIVRQRIGVTFSQQCTGDRMMQHNDVLVEESIANDPEQLEQFIQATLLAKKSYSDMIDTRNISIQAARSMLPHNLETFVFMNINLMTLLFFYSKRINDGSQTWQINEVSRQMEAEVCKVFPGLQEVFDKHKTSFKFQKEASADRKNMFSTGLYIPKDDEFEYHDRDFLYPMKKEEMHFTNTPIQDRFYWGTDEVTEEEFNRIKTRYEELDAEIAENYFTNDEIFQRGQDVTYELEKEIEYDRNN